MTTTDINLDEKSNKILFKVYDINEVKLRTSHAWDIIDTNNSFDVMSNELASIFATKCLTVNETVLKYKPTYVSYVFWKNKWLHESCHDAVSGLLMKVEYAFKEKLNTKVKSKNLRWRAQFDHHFKWLLVTDIVSGKKLIFEND